MGDRACRNERPFERLRRGNVRSLCTLAHGNAKAGARQIDAAAGDRLALIDELVDSLGSQNSDVTAEAGLDVLQERIRGAPGDRNFRAEGALELREKLEHHRFHAIIAEDYIIGYPFSYPLVDAGWAKMPVLAA